MIRTVLTAAAATLVTYAGLAMATVVYTGWWTEIIARAAERRSV